jgi:hypothetical protein
MDPLETLPHPQQLSVVVTSPLILVGVFTVYIFYLAFMLNCLRRHPVIIQYSVRH